jgi:hypothetical protein
MQDIDTEDFIVRLTKASEEKMARFTMQAFEDQDWQSMIELNAAEFYRTD